MDALLNRILRRFFWLGVGMFGGVAAGEERLSYNRDIRPILSENCFFCHGFDQKKREADLRLDTFEGATAMEDGEAAIVPGKPEESLLFGRIHDTDRDEMMPPPESNRVLTKEDKATLTRWIREGAEYEEHWAYAPLTRPVVPEGKSAIDAFLQRRWTEEGVKPVGAASPRALLRRLSYNLRGLPPTMEEVAAFEAEPTRERFLEIAQGYLKSLEHAEHQGRIWLDLVRWADSSGMVSDEPIDSGAYRRYVIEAFRDNMPFDQFTREQLAGDLLPERNDRTLIASGYNRLVNTNCEAGVIEEEAIYALKGEHVRAVGTVWMGATTGCAQCHDHKYDPMTAKDYYSLAAFFDDLVEIGVYEPGDRRVPLHYVHAEEGKRVEEARLAGEVERIRARLYEVEVDAAGQAEWEKGALVDLKNAEGRADFLWLPKVLPAARVLEGEYFAEAGGRRTVAEEGAFSRHVAAELITGKLDGPLIAKDAEGALYVEVTIDAERPVGVLAVQILNGAYTRVGWHRSYINTYWWGDEKAAPFGKDLGWVAPEKMKYMGTLPEAGVTTRLEIPLDGFIKNQYQGQGLAWVHDGGAVLWGDSGLHLRRDRVRSAEMNEAAMRYWWELPRNRDDHEKYMSRVFDCLKVPVGKRRGYHRDVVAAAYKESLQPELAAELKDVYGTLYGVRKGALPVLVSKAVEPRETRLVDRGDFRDKEGPVVEPRVPGFLDPLGEKEPGRRLNRLDLANWIMSEENPLTARVFVNRLWHQFYGRGISETLEDSGNQGDWPSHVQLLDWLACEFRESGWDVRHLIELMISSEAYGLSSVPGSVLAERDPTNRLHARQGRRRHDAEEIRDGALAAAGMLAATGEIPVRSFYPYQPGSYWEKSNKIMYGSRYQIWETDGDGGQYQRSVYAYWKRQNAHPTMLAFDAPPRQECTAERSVTNTPGQALALLNDPIFTEAARGLAYRVMGEGDDATRIALLFRHVLQREPSGEEAELLLRFLERQREHFAGDEGAAGELDSVGQLKRLGSVEPVEVAPWIAAARAVLNLHEFLTKS